MILIKVREGIENIFDRDILYGAVFLWQDKYIWCRIVYLSQVQWVFILNEVLTDDWLKLGHLFNLLI
jgi:hypothetical protein